MIINAKGAADFAEKYIIHSIWEGHYPPGSKLPAERELSEKIGITRTTLREVLQRLARDGWLKIQHGKPTLVNNFWETSGLNILETIAELDQSGAPKLIEHLLMARSSVSAIYFRKGIAQNPQKVVEFLSEKPKEDTAEAYCDYDYQLHRTLAFASNNPIYVLILNGFQKLYYRVGNYYFSSDEARATSRAFYKELLELAKQEDSKAVPALIKEFNIKYNEIWHVLRQNLPTLTENSFNS